MEYPETKIGKISTNAVGFSPDSLMIEVNRVMTIPPTLARRWIPPFLPPLKSQFQTTVRRRPIHSSRSKWQSSPVGSVERYDRSALLRESSVRNALQTPRLQWYDDSHLVVGSDVAVWHFADRFLHGVVRFDSIGGIPPPEPEDPSRRRHERFDTHLRQRANNLHEGRLVP